jgi:hypothetical protein
VVSPLAGLVGVISALALGRLGRLGVRGVSLSVATIGFVSGSLMPFAAYAPNPPAVGHPDTIGMRTALYFIMLAISIITAVAAVLVGRRLVTRLGTWYATLSGIAGYLLVTITASRCCPLIQRCRLTSLPRCCTNSGWQVWRRSCLCA